MKKYVERRLGEPIKFLFLPTMGRLGSQASNYELRATVELGFLNRTSGKK